MSGMITFAEFVRKVAIQFIEGTVIQWQNAVRQVSGSIPDCTLSSLREVGIRHGIGVRDIESIRALLYDLQPGP